MTEERRSEIAREAARERWKRAAEASPEATILTPEEAVALGQDRGIGNGSDAGGNWRRGKLNIMGMHVPCYVLDNGVRVIGRTSATEVLTGIKGGGALEKGLLSLCAP